MPYCPPSLPVIRYLPGRDETSQIRVGPFVQVLVAHSVHEELDLSHATSTFGMLGHILKGFKKSSLLSRVKQQFPDQRNNFNICSNV